MPFKILPQEILLRISSDIPAAVHLGIPVENPMEILSFRVLFKNLFTIYFSAISAANSSKGFFQIFFFGIPFRISSSSFSRVSFKNKFSDFPKFLQKFPYEIHPGISLGISSDKLSRIFLDITSRLAPEVSHEILLEFPSLVCQAVP